MSYLDRTAHTPHHLLEKMPAEAKAKGDEDTDDVTQPSKDPKLWWAELLSFFMIIGMVVTVMGVVVSKYGWSIVLPPSAKMLSLTTDQVNDIIASHTFLHVGGPHRGGTTILWELLREHPRLAGFGNKVGADASEGVFMQTVFPHMGVGHEINAVDIAMGRTDSRLSKAMKGLGRYAFNERFHFTEDSHLVTIQNRDKLLRQWGYFWDLERPVLLEKSPTNMVMSRLLQVCG